MKQFWNKFWKIFGAAVAAAVIISVVLGIVNNSAGFAYTMIRQIIAAALGVCGIIALVVVPVEMYIEDRRHKEQGNVVTRNF
jgi:uncharacterized membrane protein